MRTSKPIVIFVLILSTIYAAVAPASESADPLRGIDLLTMRDRESAYVSDLADGRRVTFTVDPKLQRFADSLFEKYQVPAGAAVILNSRTGRVLALAQQRSEASYASTRAVALDPSPPAASLFKIVTLAALLEKGNLTPETQSCYAGGSQKLLMQHLADPPPNSRACVSLTAALGHSINAIFAKLADSRLKPTTLEHYAARFGFNRKLPFDVPLPQSIADIPTDRLERARTAAGFWHTHLSPVHAALIVQSLAQKGVMLRPYIVDQVESRDRHLLYKGQSKYIGQTVSEATASKLIGAMTYTVTQGTARKAFRNSREIPFLHGVEVAGKTGSLTGSNPYRAYTWFAGTAPAGNPEVAIAVLIVNEPTWRIKASGMAAQLLNSYFQTSRERKKAAEPAAPQPTTSRTQAR